MAKEKHLDLIQGVITRMASNSFVLKGWAVTLIAATFAIASSDKANPRLILVALFPAFVFWLLDAYYLTQERLFRKLFDKVRTQDEKDIDYSLATKDYEPSVKYNGSLFSQTLWIFYVSLLVLIVAVFGFGVLFPAK